MRGISLDEIASATKIGTRSLKALEDENFAILPGGIFNKGFVRAYARFLGLNEEEAVADYQTAMKEQPVSVKTIAAQSAMAKANRLAAQQARESNHAAGVFRALLLLVLSAGLAWGGYKAYKGGYLSVLKLPRLHRQLQKPQPQAAAPVVSVSTASSVAPSTTVPQTAPAESPSASASTAAPAPELSDAAKTESHLSGAQASLRVPAEFTVSIRATERSWMSITMDGRHRLQKTFSANEQQEFTAKNRVRIVIGNPSATELSLNGRPLAIGGDLTRPRTVVVDATGLATE